MSIDSPIPAGSSSPPAPVHASIADICKRHGCSRTKLYALLAAKQIVARKLDRRLLVDVASADGFFAGLPEAEISVPSLRTRESATA